MPRIKQRNTYLAGVSTINPALQWWRTLPMLSKERYCMTYFNTQSTNLSNDQIKYIFNLETV